jgi:hypothetical protein
VDDLLFVAYNNSLDVSLTRDLAKLSQAGQGTGDDVIYHFLISTRAHPRPLHMRVTGADINTAFWVPGNACQLSEDDDNMQYDPFQPLESMRRFLVCARDMDPAEHYAFFYNGHGCCVYLDINEIAEEEKENAAASTATDITTTHNIGVAAMASMLQQEQFYFGLLAFDACLMATLETVYEFRNVCSYLIASEQYEGWQGLNSPLLVEEF